MKLHALYAVALLAPLMASCGTIVRGTTESVTIRAEPEDSAIRTSMGAGCPRSPCTIEVKRKDKFTAFADHPGYKPGSIEIGTKVQGEGAAGMAGNILIGGVIGVGVDAISGAALDHFPNPAIIRLEPIGSTEAPSGPVRKPDRGKRVDPKAGKPIV